MELPRPRVDLIVAGGGRHVHLVEVDVGIEIPLDHERGILRVVREPVERLLLIFAQRRVRVVLEEGVLLVAVLLEFAHPVPPNGGRGASIPCESGATRARNRSSAASSMRATARTRSSASSGPMSETESGRPSGELPAGAVTTGSPARLNGSVNHAGPPLWTSISSPGAT